MKIENKNKNKNNKIFTFFIFIFGIRSSFHRKPIKILHAALFEFSKQRIFKITPAFSCSLCFYWFVEFVLVH